MTLRACMMISIASPACTDAADEPAHEERAALSTTSSAELQRTLDEVVAAGVAPGVSIRVQHPDYRAWAGASGVSSVTPEREMTPRQRFRAGSMLKMAVATAVLQLVERDRLSLTDTVDHLLPADIAARVPGAPSITLRMLLNHTSGIPEFSDEAFDALVLSDPLHVWTLDELLDRAFSHPVTFPPGAGWSYSNTNYTLLGEIVTRATGRPWRHVVRDRVFARARLSRSVLPAEGDARCPRCARGYELVDGALVDITEVDPSMAGAAGGDALITTTSDLARFLDALFAGELFDEPATLQLMLELTPAPVPEEAQTHYGLGIVRDELNGVEMFGHLGGTAGFQGFMFYQPSTGVTLTGYMNTRGDLGAFLIPVLDAVSRIPPR